MPTSDSVLLSVTGRISHAQDFSFEKKSGEIANELRSSLLASPDFGSASFDIDNDGDIAIRRLKGSCYIRADGILVISPPIAAKDFREVSDELPSTLETLFALRSQFSPESFELRCFFRVATKTSLELFKSHV